MALRDYAELDEDDFYGQGFRRDGKVSVWGGITPEGEFPKNLDLLQDLCGVGYYSLDNQEVNIAKTPTTLARLLEPVSYSKSFVDAVRRKMKDEKFLWVLVQFDFAYKPEKVKREIAPDPKFIGVFEWNDKEDDEDDD